MDILVEPEGWLNWGEHRVRCALGKGGIRNPKTEGDGGTPSGCFSLRRVLFRRDRLKEPTTGLSVQPIHPTDGWCDDPTDPLYNRPVQLPYPARHEQLWRADEIYDIIVVLGHNDDPVVPSDGSAVFLHVAKPDFSATEGCVAIKKSDLLDLLTACSVKDRLCINQPA